jgi:hypothetical protein
MRTQFVPDSFQPPTSFEGAGFHLEPLGPEHNERDHDAWMSSVDLIHATPGEWGEWPTPMTLEENMADMEMHAQEFIERKSFTYSVLDGDTVIGCLYMYPDSTGQSSAYISSWVRETRAEMDVAVWRSVTAWLESGWPFDSFRYAGR